MISSQYLYALYLGSVDALIMPLLKARHLGMLGGTWMFPLAFLVYGSQSLIFYNALSTESMGILNILWDVISDVLVFIVGIYFFGEKLNGLQCLGVVFSLVGITLLGYGKKD